MPEIDLSQRKAELARIIRSDRVSSEQLAQIEGILGVLLQTSNGVAEVIERTDPGMPHPVSIGDLGSEQGEIEVSKTGMDQSKVAEAVEIDPRLVRYHGMYERWAPADKARAPWKLVQERLLANDAHFLKKGEAMNEGGVLFGVDTEGNPLIADGGVEPIMTGMNYAETRKAVMGEKEKATGYEMFPYVEPYSKSPEIFAFEQFTGHPVVKSKDGKSYREIWLDSGENDANSGIARVANFNPSIQYAYVLNVHAEDDHENRGVRRLLRVRT